MIPVYRKIRKKMADDNKPIKYARYAIGEILLVVVGILIAVQVNTWNEERKQRQVEVKYFYNLKNDLLADLAQLDVMVDFSRTKVQASAEPLKIVIKMKDNKSYQKELAGIKVSSDIKTLSIYSRK